MVRIEKTTETRLGREVEVIILTNGDNISRSFQVIKPGETITSEIPFGVGIYSGGIEIMVSEELLKEFEKLLKESPTGCVLHFGSSCGGTYYFKDKATFWAWHDRSRSFKTSAYPGATMRSGRIEAVNS